MKIMLETVHRVVHGSAMVTKQQRAAAAWARAARWPRAAQATCNSNAAPTASNPAVIEIDYDSPSEQDCGYTRGVNYRFSDTEYDPATESEWSNGSGSDEDSVVKLGGDELDANLHELRKKAHDKALEAFPKYAQIVMKKSAVEWKKAEKNRTLGYTGNSQRTQRRGVKEARDRAAIREEAKSSCAWVRSGLGTKDAQLQVRKFSSTTYKSHRRIPDGVASAF
ncbi:hypothetical protein BD769DRAFT_1455487, partial [Suillus cothurnatus]